MPSRFRLVLLVVLSLSTVPGPASADVPAAAPSDLIARFQDAVLDVLKGARMMSVKERYDRLHPHIAGTFNMAVMARIATGHHWEAATEEQRRQAVRAFERMSVSTVATLFDDYGGQVFERVGERDGPQGTRLVDTRLVSPDGATVDLTYVTKIYGERWWAVDVVVDRGISELNVRISEYRQVLDKKGIAGLIDLLNAKADGLMATTGGPQ